MNIEKFKQQHVDILSCIAQLRNLSKSGVSKNADAISKLIVTMSSTIRLHLAVEDKMLYPALEKGGDVALASLGRKFKSEMTGIASAYLDFARRWNTASTLMNNPDGFRTDANIVLKTLYERMRREDTDFYPLIEAS